LTVEALEAEDHIIIATASLLRLTSRGMPLTLTSQESFSCFQQKFRLQVSVMSAPVAEGSGGSHGSLAFIKHKMEFRIEIFC
jgi:hypothetical protein